jgi:MerR-like DNA binding protein
MTEPLLPIGQFARLCRLSVKQLRHYDELGLLRPAEVDAHTGYRYYRRDQARDALLIGLPALVLAPVPAHAGRHRPGAGGAGPAARGGRRGAGGQPGAAGDPA